MSKYFLFKCGASFVLVSVQSVYHFHGTLTRNHRTPELGWGRETDTDEKLHPCLDSVLG